MTRVNIVKSQITELPNQASQTTLQNPINPSLSSSFQSTTFLLEMKTLLNSNSTFAKIQANWASSYKKQVLRQQDWKKIYHQMLLIFRSLSSKKTMNSVKMNSKVLNGNKSTKMFFELIEVHGYCKLVLLIVV